MARLSTLKMDLSDVAEVDYVKGVTVGLKRMPNPDFDAYMSKLKKPQLRRIRTGKMSGDEMADLVKEAMAHTVVIFVKGLEDDDDKTIEYTPAWGLQQFRDPEMYDFYQFCREEAADIDNFRREDEDDAAKN